MSLKCLILLLLSFFILSCSSDNDVNIDYSLRSDSVLYNEALIALKKKEYLLAHELFTELDLQHPYSKWATKGQLMSGFALYKNNKYDEAIFTLNKFINLNPNNPDLDYAYYLKGYCYFERINQVTRDQKYARNAYNSFIELNNKFPKSKYLQKSKKHIILLNNQLAGKEMSIGKFYQTKGNFLSGLLRYKYILKNYKKSAQIPEALYRIIECYLSLGLKNPAIRFTKILSYNFSTTEWYADAQLLMKKHSISLSKDYEKDKSLDFDNIDSEEFNSF
tara:strand:+ start:995 stop:1825 length:831 start_codon:yes stop_codon:yes gene_type:complete